MAPPAAIEIDTESPAACIVTLRGDHDLSTRAGVATALAIASGHLDVLVDLSECTFIEASVIGELLLAARRLRERDGALDLVVRSDAHALRRTLQIASVHRTLPYHTTRAAGIASVESASRLRALRHARQDLRVVSAKIDRYHAKIEISRSQRTAKGPRTTVIRAQIADSDRRALHDFPPVSTGSERDILDDDQQAA
jgi:anti-anti-sigma factor